MKILVTGTAGFIGYHVANKLLEMGDTVIGIDSINDYYPVSLKLARLTEAGIDTPSTSLSQSTKYPNYSFQKLDISEEAQLDQLFLEHQFDRVIHLAAQAGVRYSLENPKAYITANIVGFINILENCRQHKIQHLVYASSSSVYGNSDQVPFSEQDQVDYPLSLYAATKKSNELMAHSYSHLYQLPTTGLRFFTVYGPWGRPDMAPMLFAKAISEEKPIKVFNKGEMSRDFTYIDDIVNGIVAVADNVPTISEKQSFYRLFNIGNATPVKLMDFIQTLELALGKEAIKEMYPMQAGDVKQTYADVSALKQSCGYSPKTSLKEGIGELVKWYKAYNSLD
ncbi:MAG: NAD-dependent epimerase [Bacteroidales bacterium]|jgi:UDP-glucuronate 4-epimerase|nr:NAD-dependent epimerase [Bacteroidales bacterium]